MRIVIHKYSDIGDGSELYRYEFKLLKRGNLYWSKTTAHGYKVLFKFGKWVVGIKQF